MKLFGRLFFASLFGLTQAVATPVEKFDIDSAYEYARSRNTDVQIANLRLDTMINNVKLVEFRYYPDIAINITPLSYRQLAQTNRSPESLNTLEPVGSVVLKEHLPTNTDITARYSSSINNVGKRTEAWSIRFDQELLKADEIDRLMTIAIQKRELQRVARISIERTFLNNFRRRYYDYLDAKEGLAIIRRKSKEEEFLRDQSRRQYQAGIIAEYNLLDYMIDFNDSESERVAAETAYILARNNLFEIMEIPVDDSMDFKTVGIDEATTFVWNLDDMMKSALEQNLEIATFRDAVFTSEVNLKYIFDDYLPSIKAYGGFEDQVEDNNFNDKTAKTSNWVAGLQLTWSLFQNTFATRYNYLNEKNTQRIAELQLEDTVRTFKIRILNDVTTLERLYTDYLMSYERESLAKRDFDLSNDRMKTGTISAWDMIRTKNRYFAAMRRTIQRKYAFLKHVADMFNTYPVNDDMAVKYANLSSKNYFIGKSKEAEAKKQKESAEAEENLKKSNAQAQRPKVLLDANKI